MAKKKAVVIEVLNTELNNVDENNIPMEDAETVENNEAVIETDGAEPTTDIEEPVVETKVRRANNTGSIYPILKDGNPYRYGFCLQLGKAPDGFRLRHLETAKTLEEIEAKLENAKLRKNELRLEHLKKRGYVLDETETKEPENVEAPVEPIENNEPLETENPDTHMENTEEPVGNMESVE